MKIFEWILVIMNSFLFLGFAAAFFIRAENNVKIAGFIFGVVSLCNLYFIFNQVGIL